MVTGGPDPRGPRFSAPEDFVVEELPAYRPSGEGGHTFLWIEKRLRNSEEVARWLAREAGVPARDVGYAGRKDRFAVTRQFFSVPGLDPDRALGLAQEGVRVLEAARHPHKLRTGQLRGNRFDLRVHGLTPAQQAKVDAVRERLCAVGLPNRFGDQRFGREGGNAERGRRVLAGEEKGRDRREARFLVSALQSAVFNTVLAERPLPLDAVERGDLARRTDSGGLFLVEDPDVDNPRARRFEISATGPLFGTRMEQPGPGVRAREEAALRRHGLDPGAIRPPRGIRLRGGRRPLRVPVPDLVVRAEPEGGVLRVRVALPAGSFATVLLEELLGVVPERVSSRS
jgi:tRNA pseudouridine13 synthase